MKLPRIAVVCVSSALLTSLACSDDDTVLSLNVTAQDDVGEVSKLSVKITQGSTELVHEIVEPNEDIDGSGPKTELTLKNRFYERITLPDSFKDGNTRIDVDAYDTSGAITLTAPPTFVRVREHEVVTAFVEFDRPDPPVEPPPPEGGAGGEGGMPGETGGTGGTGGASGGTSGSGGAGGGAGGAAPSEAGAGGADAGSGGAQ